MSTAVTGTGRNRMARSGAPSPGRRPGWAAVALLLVVGLGVLGAYLYQQAGAKVPVVVVVGTVPAGHIITRADLSQVAMAGDLPTIAGRDLGQVVGRRAAVTLLAGTPVQAAMLTSAAAPKPGQAQVGLALGAGQVPADGVQAGDTVEILQLPGSDPGSTDGEDPVAQVLVASAPVWSARPDPARSGGFLLTVTVPAETAGQIAVAGDGDHVAVVRVVAKS
jgi:hypothetical protein